MSSRPPLIALVLLGVLFVGRDAGAVRAREGTLKNGTAYKVTPHPVQGRGDAGGYTVTVVREDGSRAERIVRRNVNRLLGPRVVKSKQESRTGKAIALKDAAGQEHRMRWRTGSRWDNYKNKDPNPAARRRQAKRDAAKWPSTGR